MRTSPVSVYGIRRQALVWGAAIAIAFPWAAPVASASPQALYPGALGAVSQEAGGAPVSVRRRNPVLILPGFLMPEFTYEPLRQSLLQAGYTDVTILQGWPWCRSILEYSTEAQAEVDRALLRTGASQVELVCHSMGGLVGRHLMQTLGYETRVAHYVSFGTPHHGTLIGPLASWYARSAEEMTPNSPFHTALNVAEGQPTAVKLTSLSAAVDEIVYPRESVVLAGASNAEVPWSPHIGGIFYPELARLTIEALAQ
jgi:pimeloyl-ACP methyl ester carboxylesterase